MAKTFETFKLNESSSDWSVGEYALVLISDKLTYFITDKNRPAKRDFDILEAIIQLKAIDRDSNKKWIGEIVWLGQVRPSQGNAQILGTPIESAMKSGTGSNGGRKINRLIVHLEDMKRNDILVKAIMSENVTTFKKKSFIPLQAQVYTTAGLPMKQVMKQYTSSAYPISLKASLLMNQPATYIEDNDAIVLTNVFDGDRTATSIGTYTRMLNQAGYTFTQEGDNVNQSYTIVTFPMVFPNARVADEFKKWFKQTLPSFKDADKNLIDDFSNDWNGIKREDDGSVVNIKTVKRTPHELKAMVEDKMGNDTENTELMSGEDAVTDLFEKRSKKR